ncbi:MAG: LacI family transcriptional regulator [Promicromonosporaceae bacterium]|nr:LacI family transcriptional regulator [Promicromonosporaceae bacterium]
MAVTLRDVAARAGVSFKTVSNVINDYPHIRPATRERVEQAIAELGYTTNIAARNLRRGRTGMISLAVPELRVSYFAELADSVMRAAEARDLALMIEQTGYYGEREPAVLGSAMRRFTDGLILATVAADPYHHPELKVSYPLVLLGDRMVEEQIDHVTMANVEGARAATEHLLAIGCRNIAVLGVHPEEEHGTAALRLEGYRQALAAAGIAPRRELEGDADRWVRGTGVAAMRQVLDSGTKVDGVFGMNDSLALGALHEIQSRGLRVPQDVALIGFDNIDAAQYSGPGLTTIDPNRDEIANRAVELLMARIDGGEAPAARFTASFTLVQRESTSCQASS